MITARRGVAVVVVVALALGVVVACQQRRGPDPTLETISAETGPFAIEQASVGSGHGFARGTIYYPTDTSQGDFGVVAVVPGFLSPESTIAWYGPRVASQGFVVITIETTSVFDDPAGRAVQLQAALDYVTTESVVQDRVDPERLAVMGWSMGGGGSLVAAEANPEIDAVVPLAPWHASAEWSGVDQPTLVVGCEDDTVAPVGTHAEPFYESLSGEKAYLEIADGAHGCVISPDTTIARSVIAWLKRWVDGDTRYAQFLCPPPSGATISEHRDTCPY